MSSAKPSLSCVITPENSSAFRRGFKAGINLGCLFDNSVFIVLSPKTRVENLLTTVNEVNACYRHKSFYELRHHRYKLECFSGIYMQQ